jgi:hypothetical protein
MFGPPPQLALDPVALGPWESVKDASADSAQAAGFTEPAAVGKGYELSSTDSGQVADFMKGAGGGPEEGLLPAPLCSVGGAVHNWEIGGTAPLLF